MPFKKINTNLDVPVIKKHIKKNKKKVILKNNKKPIKLKTINLDNNQTRKKYLEQALKAVSGGVSVHEGSSSSSDEEDYKSKKYDKSLVANMRKKAYEKDKDFYSG